ncbi:sirohydrochlorin cobaltochelatase [Oceanotoga teriensis]|uniref:sirohydrochlorin cobaltochelatase n=1 Tax=Oceanotoga teriensis TaxID=515440 RepID=UPI002712AA9A|nr:sirohydrochlorin cobaltochelatase [Oceanotoga teriensis]MDO7977477.1 sirohydrochlorin cobaltochelatase [Oceanotoga teriensis]
MKKGLLIVSFGTTHIDTRKKTIDKIEEISRENFSQDYEIKIAYTSSIVRKRVKQNENKEIYSPEEAVLKFKEEGIKELYVLTTHFMNGHEYNKLSHAIMKERNNFEKIKITRPILTSTEDLKKIAKFIISLYELKEYEALVLMGHGSDHHSNTVYGATEKIIEDYSNKNIIIGTVEGYPDIETVIKRLNKKNIKKVYLKPFMLVAGDHAKNDMSGEEEDSWKNILEKEGFEVVIDMKPMGEYEEVQKMYMEHLKNII